MVTNYGLYGYTTNGYLLLNCQYLERMINQEGHLEKSRGNYRCDKSMAFQIFLPF